VPHTEALVTAPVGAGQAALPRFPVEGVRVVTRDTGRQVDLMPSPSSSYLLPELASSSLVRREARSGASAIRFPAGDVVELFDEIYDARELDDLQSGMSLRIIGAGAIGAAFAVDALPGLLAAGTISNVTVRMPTTSTRTAAPAIVTAPGVAVEELPAKATADVIVDDPAVKPLAPDAPVSAIATRIAELSALSDDQLAGLFKIHRETYCRWRTGALPNPRIANRQRLGLLLSLLEALAGHEVNIKNWLLGSIIVDGLTPYELLDRGRIDDVAYAAAALGETGVVARDSRLATGIEEEPLEFGYDDVWEIEPPPEEDER
jgi:hypothetical protein